MVTQEVSLNVKTADPDRKTAHGSNLLAQLELCPKHLNIHTYIHQIQSTLAISTSVISNNRLSRSEILVPVLT